MAAELQNTYSAVPEGLAGFTSEGLRVASFPTVVSNATYPVNHGWLGKRAADIGLSLALLIVATPFLLLAAFAIKATDPGAPVFFRHKRVGRAGKEFQMLKFRTMYSNAEERLHADIELMDKYIAGDHKIADRLDPRVTKIGRLLRCSSIDELPQLFNVLIGQMSLVGPRPVERAQLHQYEARKEFYCGMRPGLTGFWQVSGRSMVKFPERAELDEDYYRRCTFSFDFKILLKTPWAVLRGLNAD